MSNESVDDVIKQQWLNEVRQDQKTRRGNVHNNFSIDGIAFNEVSEQSKGCKRYAELQCL